MISYAGEDVKEKDVTETETETETTELESESNNDVNGWAQIGYDYLV